MRTKANQLGAVSISESFSLTERPAQVALHARGRSACERKLRYLGCKAQNRIKSKIQNLISNRKMMAGNIARCKFQFRLYVCNNIPERRDQC